MSIVNEHQPIRPQSAIKTPVRPRISNIDNFTQDKLFQIVKNDKSSSAAFQCLIELVHRTTQKNQELAEKVIMLEQEVKNLQMALNTPKKRCGRKAENYNMAVIIKQSLDYLVELGELSANPFSILLTAFYS